MARLPSKDIVIKWSNEQLLQWLQKEDFHDCLQAFKIRAITGAKLLELSDDLVITFSELKIQRRRQIVKCINECKTQACNAKKLVETIKDHSKQRPTERSEEDDDDVGWGSDFDDDDDSDENDDSIAQDIPIKSKNSFFEYNLPQSCEDLVTRSLTNYMSNGSFRSLDENQFHFNNNNNINNGNHSEDKQQTNESKFNHRLTDRTNSENSVLVETKLDNNINQKQDINICSNDINDPKPKPSPRLLPKPPTTKPEVPKNKPQIIPRKPNVNYGTKPTTNGSIKRPPSDPPPPPLPTCPPPASPSINSHVLDEVFKETFKFLDVKDEYESLVLTEDEYLAPNAPILMNRKNSSSTISSQSTGYSIRDGESPNGYSLLPESQMLSQSSTNVNALECDYPPFLEGIHKEESVLTDENTEQNYEVVSDNQTNDILAISQRPALPKIKESPINAKSKRIPDLFPNLPKNWNKNPKEKKNTKENSFEDLDKNSLPSLTSDSMNLGITTRPLPPLPPLPSLPSLSPLSQSHTFSSNESLRSYEWFHEVEREDSEALLMTQDDDGAYLVRESKRAGKSNPYTLTIYHNGRVFHLNIRKRPDGLYALGKEKSREKTFKTVADLVSYHTMEPILLTTRGTPAGKTRLITTPSS